MLLNHLPEELLTIIIDLVSQERNPDLSELSVDHPQFVYNGGYSLSLTTRQLRWLCLPKLFSHLICTQSRDISDLIRLRDFAGRYGGVARFVRCVLFDVINSPFSNYSKDPGHG